MCRNLCQSLRAQQESGNTTGQKNKQMVRCPYICQLWRLSLPAHHGAGKARNIIKKRSQVSSHRQIQFPSQRTRGKARRKRKHNTWPYTGTNRAFCRNCRSNHKAQTKRHVPRYRVEGVPNSSEVEKQNRQ